MTAADPWPSMDLLTMGRLFSLELPDGRGPVTVVADHVATTHDLLLDPDTDRPLGRLWRVELAWADTEAIPQRLGWVAAGKSLHTSNGWAVVHSVAARLDWHLERRPGSWELCRDGGVTLVLLFPQGRAPA